MPAPVSLAPVATEIPRLTTRAGEINYDFNMEERRHPNHIKNPLERRIVLGTLLAAFTAINITGSIAYLIVSRQAGSALLSLTGALIIVAAELTIMTTAYFITLRLSHHITGPVYATERRLQQVQNGNLKTHSHLRRGDQFHDMEAVVNQTTDDLRERVARMKILAGTLRNDLGADSPAIATLEALDEELAHFDTEDRESPAL